MAPTLSRISEDEVFVADLPPPPLSCRAAPAQGLDTNPFAGTLDGSVIDLEMKYADMFDAMHPALTVEQLHQVGEPSAIGPVR